MRKVIAVTLSLAVHAAAIGAPFVHAHPDDHATGHHGPRAIHSHRAGHAASHHHAGGPALQTEDHDRAVFLGAMAAVAASTLDAPGVTHGVFVLPVPVDGVVHRGLEIAHGHDPPLLVGIPSRAPPACLS